MIKLITKLVELALKHFKLTMCPKCHKVFEDTACYCSDECYYGSREGRLQVADDKRFMAEMDKEEQQKECTLYDLIGDGLNKLQ